MTYIGSTPTSVPSAGGDYYEKNVADVNNVDESFDNARDLGYLRHQTYRVSVAGALSANFDATDIYKIQIQSNNKLTLSFRNSEAKGSEKVLNLDKYNEFYKELLSQTDPQAYDELIAKEAAEQRKSSFLEYVAPGFKVEVYKEDHRGNKELIADSSGHTDIIVNSYGKTLGYVSTSGSLALNDDGEIIGYVGANGKVTDKDGKLLGSVKEAGELRKNFDDMLTGDYKAEKGNYYVKISRDSSITEKDEIYYVMQMSMGSYKYDYLSKEAVSEDVKNGTLSLYSQNSTDYSQAGTLLAAQMQGLSDMLTAGYQNYATISYSGEDRLKALGDSLFSCLL